MKRMMLAVLAASTILAQPAHAELSSADQSEILQTVTDDAKPIEDTALAIWNFAELGYKETQSSDLLQEKLKQAGFSITPGIAGEPTAFMASYKNGDGPVIALLAEYDALPGLSQKAGVGTQESLGGIAGHGCGHNLFGTASTYAGIAVKEWMKANNVTGEVRVYGTPAEEGGSGKAFMVRDGYFDDVDIAVHWHPGNTNSASQGPTLANISGKFRFHGVSAHAAGNPDKGRSALDGVEAMDDMVNMLREHIPDRTRIHYVITDGGKAPNVVPNFAEVYYYVRHQDPEIVRSVMDWVKQAADGAAMGTQTTVEFEQTGGVYSMMPNETLMHVMDRNLHKVGGITWTEEEKTFGAAIQKSFGREAPSLDSVGDVEEAELYDQAMGGSTDVSDISWIVPTVGLSTATFVPGSPGHSWQNVAASGSSVGIKGAMVATKTLALTTADLFRSPDVIAKAKDELKERVGPDFEYRALVGDRAPPLDYRDAASKSE
ncbi:amidohydrolase [Altericroceibacterium spongiae]|uniref:Amidohydrolase n=1 Tax=Altericroceibacterium spongiae TaxID=2320269 RepID=A0A420ELU5_9SPHN|nr:amidohydrolase [Altericroceibacterium spongiae]RKF21692.1 amidohydrolase [Altericroceibacterium spongiae]